jgi:hypothetical protein
MTSGEIHAFSICQLFEGPIRPESIAQKASGQFAMDDPAIPNRIASCIPGLLSKILARTLQSAVQKVALKVPYRMPPASYLFVHVQQSDVQFQSWS